MPSRATPLPPARPWTPRPNAWTALAAATVLGLVVLAGCASRDEGASAPALAPASPTASSSHAGAPAAATVPRPHQEASFAWTVSGDACAFAQPADDTDRQAYRPEAKGVLYDLAAVDPATWNGTYRAQIAFDQGATGHALVFWMGAVGPGGLVVGANANATGLAQENPILTGHVPAGADFVTLSGCSPGGATATYIADGP